MDSDNQNKLFHLLVDLFPSVADFRQYLLRHEPSWVPYLIENRGLAVMVTELIHRLDSHGEISPSFFQKLAETIPARSSEIEAASSIIFPSETITTHTNSMSLERARTLEKDLKLKKRQILLGIDNETDINKINADLETVSTNITRLELQATFQRARPILPWSPAIVKGMILHNRYECVSLVGRGSFSQVWKAWDSEKEQVIAVKILRADLIGEREKVRRFFLGAEVMAMLNHPHIVQVVGGPDQDGKLPFFAMEYLPSSLDVLIQSNQINIIAGLEYIKQIGAALNYLHERGYTHRDIKPQNILIGSGTAKLTDFDLVKTARSEHLTNTKLFGTFGYAAPETMEYIENVEIDARADVYGLGMTTLYVAFNGKVPFQKVIYDRKSFFDSWIGPTGFQSLIKKATSVEKSQRHRSVVEFCEELSSILSLAGGNFTIKRYIAGSQRPTNIPTTSRLLFQDSFRVSSRALNLFEKSFGRKPTPQEKRSLSGMVISAHVRFTRWHPRIMCRPSTIGQLTTRYHNRFAGRRVRVQAGIGWSAARWIPVEMFLDTGADLALIRKDWIDELAHRASGGRYVPFPSPHESLSFEVGGQIFSCPMRVDRAFFPNRGMPGWDEFLLGRDQMSDWGWKVEIDFAARTFTIST